MSAFLGVVRYEYRMAIRRRLVWIGSAVAALPAVLPAVADPIRLGPITSPLLGPTVSLSLGPAVSMWTFAGRAVLQLNLLMPIIAGIVMADRLPRDFQLGTREFLSSTPLGRRAYVLGKYAGVVAATVTPALAAVALLVAVISARSLAAGMPPVGLAAMAGSYLAGFLAITVPAYLFVGAFSLACTAVLPVRVYQVLYIGYWLGGNFLPPVARTPLTPYGKFAAAGFFGAGDSPHTPAQAWLSIAMLLACAAVALFALERYLARQERQA